MKTDPPQAGVIPPPDPARRDTLRYLFSPQSVAVVGASDDPAKWGNWLSRGALRGAHRRSVYLVNPNRSMILGERAWTRVSDIPGGVELAVLAVPAPFILSAAKDALNAGAKALVAIAAGFSESGPSGSAVERELVDAVRKRGAVLLGPNCLGLFDASSDLYLTSNDLPAGPVALISQSGNLALELGALAGEVGLGFSRFASVGNQADVDMADLLLPMADAPDVRAVAVYGEDWRDGRRFLSRAVMLRERGIGVVLLTVGSGQAAVRAARSHTGALVTDTTVMEAGARAAGIHLVSTPGEMVDRLQLLAGGKIPRGHRLAIVADGGGHGVLAADQAERRGLQVPRLSDRAQTELGRIARGSTENPVDLAGAGEGDVQNFVRVAEILGQEDSVDAVLLSGYFGGYHLYGDQMAAAELKAAEGLGAWARASGRTLLVHSMHRDSAAIRQLREAGVPVYARVEGALSALAGTIRAMSATGIPDLPPAAPPLSASGYAAARAALEAAHIPFPASGLAETPDEAVRIADATGYPVVVKAAFLLHKSDAGGVVLNLRDGGAVRAAVMGIRNRIGTGVVSVEAMAPAGGQELLLGVRQDPRFGPVILAGLGGIYAEIMGDTTVALAPVDDARALDLLGRLRGAPLLSGSRGQPALDLLAAAQIMVRLSELAARHPEWETVEINPLRLYTEGALALDARIVVRPS